MNHLETNNLLGNHQYGFRSKRSCLAQMLKYYENVLKSMENGLNSDFIYLDFEKAFDKVDFGLL